MVIKLYNVSDDNNVLNKTLTDEKSIEIKLKSSVDISRPAIVLKSESFLNYNYAFIPVFQRYYYIDKISIIQQNIYEISLIVDVLMSFKSDILNSEGLVTQSTETNPYFNSGYKSEIKKEVDIFKSDTEIDYGSTNVLITVGV